MPWMVSCSLPSIMASCAQLYPSARRRMTAGARATVVVTHVLPLPETLASEREKSGMTLS
jgi:hypothetical protein